MTWFDPIVPKRRVARTIYLNKIEVEKLMFEGEEIKKLLGNGKTLSLSDIIRVKLFYTEQYIREMRRK